MIHLTLTGYYAGQRLCLSDRADGEQNAHAVYAPLNKPGYRLLCCLDCLAIWDDSSESDDSFVDNSQNI